MSLLVAIEGIDGSGKGTQARRLKDALNSAGVRTALLSFPRYRETRFGTLIGDFLNGRFGELDEVSPFFAALLFAGDRFESRGVIENALADNEVVICDRYVASNIAHQGAKLDGDERAELIDLVTNLEYNIYGLPTADLVLYLDLPVATAQDLIAQKASRDYTEKAADLQEADGNYLSRVRDVYLELAASDWNWHRIECLVDGDKLKSIEAIAAELHEVVVATL